VVDCIERERPAGGVALERTTGAPRAGGRSTSTARVVGRRPEQLYAARCREHGARRRSLVRCAVRTRPNGYFHTVRHS
jgi:hypothetical protein